MSEYIKKEDVLTYMRNRLDMQDAYLPIHFIQFVIDEMPAADVRGNVRAEWINEYDGFIPWTYRCSNCGNRIFSFEYEERAVKYCGRCGAEMEGM